MLKIELEINEKINFLMILYQKIKWQNNFDNLNFNFEKLDEIDKKEIKEILKGKKDVSEEIDKNEKIKAIYLKNEQPWIKYFKENESKLEKIKIFFQEKIKKYDFTIFNKVGDFFETEGPKGIKFWLCLGNESKFGTGNAFNPDLIILFPREFNLFNEKNLEADFAVFIHELMHLFQNMCQSGDKELMEKVARCFAPRGILIGEEKMSLNEEELKFYNSIKEAFENKKTYKDIYSKDLNNLKASEN